MLVPRRFLSISRTYDPRNGNHVLDAIAHDGTAWWQVLASNEEDCTGWQPMFPLPEWETNSAE
jgi:hypothetical protein